MTVATLEPLHGLPLSYEPNRVRFDAIDTQMHGLNDHTEATLETGEAIIPPHQTMASASQIGSKHGAEGNNTVEIVRLDGSREEWQRGTPMSLLLSPVGQGIQQLKTQKSPLLRTSYDIRWRLFRYLLPSFQSVQLTYGPPQWDKDLQPGRMAFRMVREQLNLVLTCRQLASEITHFFYSTSTFLVAPGERDYQKFCYQGPPMILANAELFVSNMRQSTKQCVKALHLCLGPELQEKLVNNLSTQLADFRKVVVTVSTLTNMSRPELQKTVCERQAKACRLVASARAPLLMEDTLWDDCGNADTARMLNELMPNGYQRVVKS